jgi:hypothetical protein
MLVDSAWPRGSVSATPHDRPSCRTSTSKSMLRRAGSRTVKSRCFSTSRSSSGRRPAGVIADRLSRIDHGGQAAFHIRRTAAEEIGPASDRYELRRALRRHDVVMAAEVKRALPFSHEAQDTVAFHTRFGKTEFAQPLAQQVNRLLIVISRRIFSGDSDQFGGQLEHRSCVRTHRLAQARMLRRSTRGHSTSVVPRGVSRARGPRYTAA